MAAENLTGVSARRRRAPARLFLMAGSDITPILHQFRTDPVEPLCSGSGVYLVDLRAESCECLDTPPEGEVCKHGTAAIITRTKSEECGCCRKKVLRRHLRTVPQDHPTVGGLVEDLCECCAVSQGVA